VGLLGTESTLFEDVLFSGRSLPQNLLMQMKNSLRA